MVTLRARTPGSLEKKRARPVVSTRGLGTEINGHERCVMRLVEGWSREVMYRDYEAYRDKHGLQQPSNDGSVSHNGVRFTAQYVIALLTYGSMSYGQKVRLRGVIDRCFERPGLLMRDPTNPFQDSIDNYLALAFLSKHLNPGWAKDVLKYGRDHFGFYENKRPLDGHRRFPKLNSFLWRFPQLFYALRCAAGERPNFLQTLVAFLSIWLARSTSDQDGRVLTLILIRCSDGRSSLINWAISKFVLGFKETYPQGLGQVLGEYYKNPHHPDAKYLRHIFR